jgi:dipeptidase
LDNVHVSPRVACDSLVALSGATSDGSVLFAKNSDRPAYECQPLVQFPRQSHPSGSSLRCTYIDIPQASATARGIGSRPFWCWGFEHGINEHGVAIGNHTVFTKDGLEGKGLIGMDLVRLGLERSRSADEAVEVMTALLSQYGQGGSGYHDKDWSYHNSFLIADRRGALALETSARHWALRRVTDVASLSNHLATGADWDAISDGAIEHAIAAGWWSEERDERFDFAGAYRDTSVAPEVISSGRHRRTCALLEQEKGKITPTSLRRALRDHYGRPAPLAELDPTNEESFSVCMHADPVGTTTASVVVRLPGGDEPLIYWASLASPCVGAFVPLFVDAEVPALLGAASEQPSDDCPWWQCKRLLEAVERDWAAHLRRVRAVLDPFEERVAEEAIGVAHGSIAEKTVFMQRTADEMLEHVRQLRRDLSNGE